MKRQLMELCPTGCHLQQIRLVLIWGNALFAENVPLLIPDKIKFTTDYKIATNERERTDH